MLKASVGGDASFLSSLIADYINDTGEHLQAMQRAVSRQDADLLQRSAHSLKSTSQTMGAVGLAEISRQIETLARNDRLEEAAAQITAASEQFEAVCTVLRDQRAALDETC